MNQRVMATTINQELVLLDRVRYMDSDLKRIAKRYYFGMDCGGVTILHCGLGGSFWKEKLKVAIFSSYLVVTLNIIW